MSGLHQIASRVGVPRMRRVVSRVQRVDELILSLGGPIDWFCVFLFSRIERQSRKLFCSSIWILYRPHVFSMAKDGNSSESGAVLHWKSFGAGDLSFGVLPQPGSGAAGAVQSLGNARTSGSGALMEPAIRPGLGVQAASYQGRTTRLFWLGSCGGSGRRSRISRRVAAGNPTL